MTEYEAYQEHIRYTHDTYCRIVIRHASFDAARMLAARLQILLERYAYSEIGGTFILI